MSIHYSLVCKYNIIYLSSAVQIVCFKIY